MRYILIITMLLGSACTREIQDSEAYPSPTVSPTPYATPKRTDLENWCYFHPKSKKCKEFCKTVDCKE